MGEADGITKLVHNLLDSPELGSLRRIVGNPMAEDGSEGNPNIRQCRRKVLDGHFVAVVEILCSSGVAPYNEETVKILEAKHPCKPPPSKPCTSFCEPPMVVNVDLIFRCIKLFLK